MVHRSARLRHILAKASEWARAQDTSDWSEKRRLLRRSCHPKQRDAFDDRAKRISGRCGRGCGKTTVIRAREIDKAIEIPGAQILYFANNREQAERLQWPQLKALLTDLEIDFKPNEVRHRIRLLRNDSEIQLAGCSDKKSIDAWRGLPFHMVDVDECGSLSVEILEYLFYRIIEPRLGDYDGVFGAWGTPGHILAGLFYDVTRPGSPLQRAYADREKEEFSDWDQWSFHHWSLIDGSPYVPEMERLWAEALRAKKRNGWSDDHPVWRREYLGEWAADESEAIFKYRPHLDDGLEWNLWDPPKNRKGFAELPKGKHWRYVIGMDMGHSDPFAIEVFAYCPSEGTLYHVYEYERPELHPTEIAKVLIGPKLDAKNPDGVIHKEIGWPDAMVADTSHLGGSILDELLHVHRIPIAEADRRQKHDAIELLNGDLLEGKVKILKGSSLEKQFQHLRWQTNKYGERKEPRGERNDCADAAIYARKAAHHQFVKPEAQKRPERGTKEHYDLMEREEEERIARKDKGFDSFLRDKSYDFLK